jgi:hypothetical protein
MVKKALMFPLIEENGLKIAPWSSFSFVPFVPAMSNIHLMTVVAFADGLFRQLSVGESHGSCPHGKMWNVGRKV